VIYAAARAVLLDALQALGTQRDAVILAGAQAIYLHTGAIELPVAEYTTDADERINFARHFHSPASTRSTLQLRWARGQGLSISRPQSGSALR
jgi:hypothetical protein